MSDISFMMEHTKIFGELLWDIVAFLLLVAVVIFYFVRRRKMNKEEESLEDEISENYANEGRRSAF